MGDIARNENFEISAITVLRLRTIWQRFYRTDFPKTKALDVLETAGLKPGTTFELVPSAQTGPLLEH